jgi:hypothetical protein
MVTNQGKTHWMIIDDAFIAENLIEFLAYLIKDAGKKSSSAYQGQVTRDGQRTHDDARQKSTGGYWLRLGPSGSLCCLPLETGSGRVISTLFL